MNSFAYLPREAASVFCKLAEEAAEPKKPLSEPQRVLRSYKPLLVGAAGYGLGHLAGKGIGWAADAISKKYTGQPVQFPQKRWLAPVLGLAGGLAYNMAAAHQMEQTRRAVQDPDH